MRIKTGTFVPKTGTDVHPEADLADYRTAIAAALRNELGLTHRAVKTAMRWTGASERTVKYWIAGERGPSGAHLIALARHSDIVFHMVLLLADRTDGADSE
ncbi:helix-turn-helix domain-containing protein [Pseudomonas sp. GX19020]|uniref:helix-turn-helix domain-containing protein n=1 Tax=Pseudomonas sp. GX19020 TaxID=2942277 RepID=UPI00201883CA|nr:helix-turn-helix transcriptional regulator [Pseudomonas sp. GX19020]MCL4069366.1 helix-turn-helix domain-containing protein [Pseudomonas sp. GX19020]